MKLKQVSPEVVNNFNKGTLMEQLDIRCVEVGEDYIVATMPVDSRTHQPMGMLHGGASVALIESTGSIGSALLIDTTKHVPIGLEINANHISGVRSGLVRATAKVVHAGRRTHVWQVDVRDDETNKLVCTGRHTVMIIDREG